MITSVEKIIEKYSVLLLDAYGVIVDQTSALPGAKEFISRLNRLQKPYFIVTNDSSKQPQTLKDKYKNVELDIPSERIITSGSLIKRYFKDHNLSGSRCLFLGSDDARGYVEECGGNIVPLQSKDTIVDVAIICDGGNYSVIDTLDLLLSVLFHHFDCGKSLHLVLANPDFIYPKTQGYFGITSGSLALILENALKLRYPKENITFARLGKPHRYIFEEAFARCGTKDAVMVGDQLVTDIKGAVDFGIDSVLIGTGVTNLNQEFDFLDYKPTYILHNLKTE
ncbi:HAD-IIA family hydrolase [Candidatus Uabimicrobium sp. HlEnr_7]|uniref:HAD-IIA family hydrolase n=1 Tax=Candidatus Uabimicrobium helgolandensis TaxID=3095367 RepID=UPI0035560658